MAGATTGSDDYTRLMVELAWLQLRLGMTEELLRQPQGGRCAPTGGHAVPSCVLDQLPSALVLAAAPPSSYVHVTPRVEDILGWPITPQLRRQLVEPRPPFLRQDAKAEWLLCRCLRDGKSVVDEEAWIVTAAGEERAVSLDAAAVSGSKGEGTIGAVLTIHPAEGYLRAEQERQRLRIESVEMARRARRRLGEKLHAGPMQYVAVAQNVLRAVLKDPTIPDMARAQISDAIDLNASGIAEMRSLLAEMAPGGSGRPLPDRISDLAARPWPFDLRVDDQMPDIQPDELAAETIFLATQECLFNVTKHAGASHVSVGIRLDRGQLVAAVQDDGQGFDPATVQPTADGGFGLANFREKLKALGGGLEVDSALGAGTTVLIRVPVSPRDGIEAAIPEVSLV